jgi:hypothetical protein
MNNVKLFSSTLLYLSLFSAFAQNTTSGIPIASSGVGKTATTTLSWTIGQPIIKNFTDGNSSLSSGNQQTDVKLFVTAIDDKNVSGLLIQAYPNPTQNMLTISFNESINSASTYDLISIDGKCVSNNTIVSNKQSIDVSTLPEGVYILHVYLNNAQQSFKIIKL